MAFDIKKRQEPAVIAGSYGVINFEQSGQVTDHKNKIIRGKPYDTTEY